MDIAKTIAKYRKAKNLTQEALGELVGVSNQAVSKWENGSSSPDITIIPALANALGISLEQFFGLSEEAPKPDRIRPDDFPDEAYEALYQNFMRLWKPDCFRWDVKKSVDSGAGRFTCVSHTHGTATATGHFSYIDRTFKTPESANLFDNDYMARAITRLADKSVRKVLKHMYTTVCALDWDAENSPHCTFTTAAIAEATALSESEVEDALDTAAAYDLVDPDPQESCYYITMQNFPDLLAFLNAAKMLTSNRMYAAVRDTSMILDSAFID